MANSVFDRLLAETFTSPLEYEFWPALNVNSRKVLIVLHGRGDTREGFHFLPSALELASLNILFLQAPDPYGPGFSWYELPPRQGPGIIRSRTLLFELLEALQETGEVAALDLLLCGFSQGCLMVIDVGLRYPKVLGGIVGISGYVFFEEEYPASFSTVARDQRFLVTHGFSDEVLPFATTDGSIQRLRALGARISWVPFEKGHTVDEVEEVPAIRKFLAEQLEGD